MSPLYELSNILSHLDGDLSHRLEMQGLDTDKFDNAVRLLTAALSEMQDEAAEQEEDEDARENLDA
ncbi:hypothetical protein [Rhizobium laguerreae]|uniref:hypothetical protein n=1 Tax=Rhizobium laguerreae TaxID=1076926 RepID=UPI001C91FA9F|nr:hypothetical protein [Rhizobium laguerreae]MBY3314698.1 hypothetical protein [Rhizobium laguerreae]